MDDDENVMDEAPQAPITKEYIEGRVQDWKVRLQNLFQIISVWAEMNGWRVEKDGKVFMHEELMQKFGVPATEQPTLRLEKADAGYALFKPKGLWVIGANGRIDLYTPKGAFIIVDVADRGTTPRWTIYKPTHRKEGEAFTPEMISDLV